MKATLTSVLVAVLQSFIVAYSTFVPQPAAWHDLLAFKFIMLLIITAAGNLGLAHTNFRSPETRTRIEDPEAPAKGGK